MRQGPLDLVNPVLICGCCVFLARLEIDAEFADGAEFEIHFIAYICSDDDGLCSQLEVIAPVKIAAVPQQAGSADLSIAL